MLASKITNFIFSIVALSGILVASNLPADAAPVPAAASKNATLDINTLEGRFFGHSYGHDPLDKRLQRMELMLFGTTQSGTLAERIERIQQTAEERQHTPIAGSSVNKQNADIALLERKMLKKNFPDETGPQRLSRMEAKVFGQPANGMNTLDRIDRLKKIAGVTAAPQVSQFQDPALGNANPFPFGLNYSSPFGTSQPEMNKQMDEMFSQLNKNLRGLHKLPDGMPNYGTPNGAPFIQRMPNLSRPDTGTLPPYLDPNSI